MDTLLSNNNQQSTPNNISRKITKMEIFMNVFLAIIFFLIVIYIDGFEII